MAYPIFTFRWLAVHALVVSELQLEKKEQFCEECICFGGNPSRKLAGEKYTPYYTNINIKFVILIDIKQLLECISVLSSFKFFGGSLSHWPPLL